MSYLNKTDIINQLAREKRIERLITKLNMTKEQQFNLCDLAQDLYLDLLTKSDDLIYKLYERDEFDYFIYRMITNNIFSKNSPYYKMYKNVKYIDDLNEQN